MNHARCYRNGRKGTFIYIGMVGQVYGTDVLSHDEMMDLITLGTHVAATSAPDGQARMSPMMEISSDTVNSQIDRIRRLPEISVFLKIGRYEKNLAKCARSYDHTSKETESREHASTIWM